MELFLGRNGCEKAASLCYGCDTAANQAPTGQWFITMGHPGFNSPANNRGGYASQAAAAAAIARYGSKRPRR